MSRLFEVRVDVGRLQSLGARTQALLNDVLWKAAYDIQAGAQERAPVDLGYLKSSVQPVKTGPLEREVRVYAEYGIYQEMGTVFAPAHPFLGPAADEVTPAVEQAVAVAIRQAAGGQ